MNPTPLPVSASLPTASPLPLPTDWASARATAVAHSRFLERLLGARPGLEEAVAARWQAPLDRDALAEWLAPRLAAADGDDALKRELRALRAFTMAHLAVRDLTGLAPLAEVVETMTSLAEVTVNAALAFFHAGLAAQHGEPRGADGQALTLAVVGMGKLGGRELNVSSDIDLIFVYPEEGQTDKGLDNYDFFSRLGKRLINAIDDVTGDGRVFRVDMRLRPNGDSGPLVCSLDSLENYFITQGREWERYAWIKGRVMNDLCQTCHAQALAQVVRPFVFRKYLDFGAINAMRDLHAQIRREVARKDMADHVKLGPGGIREIEFIAQVFQLIRGGRDSQLQVKPTLEVLARLAERNFLSPDAVAELTRAYDFLRRVEHRLQWFEDAQTHRLPGIESGGGQDRARLAASMGFAGWDDFLAVLDDHRQRVSRHFEAVFADPEGKRPECEGSAPLWQGGLDDEVAAAKLTALGYRRPADTLSLIQRFRAGSRYQQLPTQNRERLDALAPGLIDAAAAASQVTGAEADETLARCLAFLETIGRRGAYLALLQQYPLARQKVAELIGASHWAADYLNHHPILLDVLLDPRLTEVREDWQADWTAFRAELARHLADTAGDAERQMDLLREAHHAQVFRLLAQDLAGLLTVERLSDNLSQLADILVQAVLELCWGFLRQRHRDKPAFAVIGYGKLGGKELGYASDLDIVFLYDDPAQEAEEVYARLAQRINTWLSSRTPAGILFETDLRLRPNGDAGLIVTSTAAFRDYQLKHAWVWEHQALTRARFVAGDPALGEAFEAIRVEVLRQPRDLQALRDEVVAMRHKMRDNLATGTDTEFDIKHDAGGIVDVEFIVQYLVLGYAHAHAELTGNLGNIALLKISADLGLIPADLAEGARRAYREYRRLQHAKRLNNAPKARIAKDSVASHIAAVTALWQHVFAAQ